MALIAEYQRSPQLGRAGRVRRRASDDATSASYTELPASYKPAPRRKPGAAGPPRSGPGRLAAWLRTHLAWVGWASVGAALIVAGVILGASLTSSSTRQRSPGGRRLRRRRPVPWPAQCQRQARSCA